MDHIPVVAGLIMRMRYPAARAWIGGPAVYAATGMRLMGIRSRMMAAVSHSMSEDERSVIELLSCDDRCITSINNPLLTWHSENILGSKGNGKLDGMPAIWKSEKNSDLLNGALVVLANGDPTWYCSILTKTQPQLTLMDFNMNWLTIRGEELRQCLRYVDVITITRHEYRSLGKHFFATFFTQKHKFLLVKEGSHGSELISGEERELLAPATPQAVITDVGCGDLLIGLLAGYLHHQLLQDNAVTFQKIKAGYLAALPWIATLLESASNELFIRGCVNEFR
ncbi:hypothetical protein IW01_14675 [Pectobacterium brasiliense]|uniref:hypothetical protein n=1 Tax=Pectobacterium brasiliense TaxID=180957 RepID=UPI0004E748D8|nr:hypothetical protein [Pectobacterium brasiliense]KFF67590.1 hypothetical protein IW01_14675 [Pectobacterium brasiliense]